MSRSPALTCSMSPNSARACRAERKDMGTDAFRAKYGTNRNKRNAFGKCVSAHVRDDNSNQS